MTRTFSLAYKASFEGGVVSYDPGMLIKRESKTPYAIAYDHADDDKNGGYFIRPNGELIKVGGAKLPKLAELLASISVNAVHVS